MEIPDIRRGEYLIIHTDGREDLFEATPTIREIQRKIGADALDTVTLNRAKQIVMFVDDSGHATGRPRNDKATELYLKRCKPGTDWYIAGDVAIVNDADFE